MTNVVSVPIFLIPLLVSALGGLITYGEIKERSGDLRDEVNKLELYVEKVDDEAGGNQKGIALNEQAIRTITESLARQHETIKQSDEKLQTLIEIMLTANQPK